MEPLNELTRVFKQASKDASFKKELRHCLETYVGRPTPLCLAERMTEELGTARIYLKREDLCHTGAHKINNAMGQILLAKRMGKKAHHCRNRSRSTWGSYGDRVCHVWV